MDFIKLILPASSTSKILNNPKLGILTKFNRSTGEITEYSEAKKNGIVIRIINKTTIIYFSAHKLYNLECKDLNDNSGDFGYTQFLWVLSYIEELFQIPLDHFKIENLEFGLNFHPTCTYQTMLIENPVIHRGDHFREMFNQKGESIGHECVHQQYNLKLYHKSKQLGLIGKEYRFEIKIKKMHFLGKLLAPSRIHSRASHVITLNDLKKQHVWEYLKKELLRVFGEILFYESIENFKDISSGDTLFILKVTNPRHWAVKQISGDEYTNAWRKYHRLIKNSCIHNARQELIILIESRLEELISTIDICEGNNLTFFNCSIGRANSGISLPYQIMIPP